MPLFFFLIFKVIRITCYNPVINREGLMTAILLICLEKEALLPGSSSILWLFMILGLNESIIYLLKYLLSSIAC